MPHNPVVRTENLSIFSSVHIEKGTVGLIYKNGRMIRKLTPGEQPGFMERSFCTLHVVDQRNHHFTYTCKLPSANPQFTFPVRIDLNYQVQDPAQMVDNRVNDTEALLVRALEPILNRQSQTQAPERFESLPALLEKAISPLIYQSLGLVQNDPPMVMLEPSAELSQYGKALLLPQQAVHDEELPSKEPTYAFKARATVMYQVIGSQLLSRETPAASEGLLWQQVATDLRAISRKYRVDEIDHAEQQLRALAEKQSQYEGYGVRITRMQVALELDPRSRDHAAEIADFQHKQVMDRLKADAARLDRAREEERVAFYRHLLTEESLRAILLANNPADVDGVMQRIDKSEKERFSRFMELIDKVREQKDTLSDSNIEQIILDLFGRSVRVADEPPRGPSLPEGTHIRIEPPVPSDGGEPPTDAEFRYLEAEFPPAPPASPQEQKFKPIDLSDEEPSDGQPAPKENS